jgi:hypothetical protein
MVHGSLAVLSNLAAGVAPPAILYLGMTVGINGLMGSTIPFPALIWIYAGWRRPVVGLGFMGLSLVGLSFFTAWLLWTSAYVGLRWSVRVLGSSGEVEISDR